MYYRHNLNFTYPERSDEHMLKLKRTRTIELDKNYDYMPHGAMFKIKRALVAAVLHIIVFPLTHLSFFKLDELFIFINVSYSFSCRTGHSLIQWV